MDDQSSFQHDSLGLSSAELTERVAHAMSTAAHAYVQTLVQELSRRGFSDLTPSSTRLLSRIEDGGSRSTGLARVMGRTKQAIGQTVTELELRGYVERVADPRDARARLVRRTPRGEAVLAAGLEIRRDLEALMVKALGVDELHNLAGALERLTASIRSEGMSRHRS